MQSNSIGANSVLEQFAQPKGQSDAKKLGQNDFLKLLITQMRNQDPLEPQGNAEFMGQMAQFGTVDGISKLQNTFESLAGSLQSNQALQASALVGRSVQIASPQAVLTANQGLRANANLEVSSPEMTVNIKNRNGEIVKHLNLGACAAGPVDIHWDGKSDSGKTMPEGTYTINAFTYENGRQYAVPTYTNANVDSVTLGRGGNGLTLSLKGLGEVNFNNVIKIT